MSPSRKGPVLETEAVDIGADTKVYPQKIAASRNGMAATAHPGATAAAVRMLEEGGNAVDAAVAAAFALGVCEPQASGLGGQTMMMIHLAEEGRTFALDGSSRSPARANVADLPKKEGRWGHRATTVPATPAVLDHALRRYGRLKLARVLQPAIDLAADGFKVTPLLNSLMKREAKHLRRHSGGPFFLKNGRTAWPVGALFRQPVLARTLKRLARDGVKDFYSGEIARRIHRDMVRNEGLLRDHDLAQVPRPVERRPVTARHGAMRVFASPPPAAGRTLVEMLNVYEQLPARLRDFDRPEGAVVLARMIQQAFLDRQDRPFDPNLYSQVAERVMLSPEYAKKVARRVSRRMPAGNGETTHLSVMDKAGNAVALTQSIENVFGSCEAAPDLGFLYNNYMNAFEREDPSHPYYLRPNAPPWASVAPTIVFRGRKPWLVIGSPGSERITPSIFQVMIRLGKVGPFAAVDAPRLHCSVKGKVSLEAARMRSDIPEALTRAGFEIDAREPYSFYMGCVQLVLRENGVFTGVADPRRDGSALGPGS